MAGPVQFTRTNCGPRTHGNRESPYTFHNDSTIHNRSTIHHTGTIHNNGARFDSVNDIGSGLSRNHIAGHG